jgi:hypothetical protein
VLVNRETCNGLGLTLYETEEDLCRGDAALNAMSPPDDAGGERTNVDFYEVALRRER